MHAAYCSITGYVSNYASNRLLNYAFNLLLYKERQKEEKKQKTQKQKTKKQKKGTKAIGTAPQVIWTLRPFDTATQAIWTHVLRRLSNIAAGNMSK